jgi:hypothetical protein
LNRANLPGGAQFIVMRSLTKLRQLFVPSIGEAAVIYMESWTKRQLLVVVSLLSLCLLVSISPEISRAVINASASPSDSPVYSNYCALPSVPAKLNDNNNRNNRSDFLNRRVDAIAKGTAYFAVGNNAKRNLSLFSIESFSLGNCCLLRLQQVCQLIDLPPPASLIS